MMDEKTMVADALWGINGDLGKFGEMIPDVYKRQIMNSIGKSWQKSFNSRKRF